MPCSTPFAYYYFVKFNLLKYQQIYKQLKLNEFAKKEKQNL